MTAQELFDRVAGHLILQGRKATDNHGGCVYRAPDGSRCAIGCLIDQYDPRMEGVSIRVESQTDDWPCDEEEAEELRRSRLVAAAAGLTQDLLPLARALQYVHDDKEVEGWPHELALVARRYGLSPAAIGAALIERAAERAAEEQD